MKIYIKMKNVSFFILFCFLFIGCSNYKIETIKYFYYGQNGFDTLVPDRFKPYLTKKQIKEFEYGPKRFSKNPCRIYHVINYLWIHDTLYNNESFKDTVVKSSEVYRCEDATVGKRIEYYLDGKISIESNYVLMNDSTKNVISMENFNKINYRDAGLAKYDSQPDGTWKYYSKEGKLIKEEVYDKGTLQKTINY